MGANVPKNLIHFIYYPGRIGHYHRLNLEYLNKYWHLFDGQKVVKVALDLGYNAKPILELLPKDCKVEFVENNRTFGEAVHFMDSINRVSEGMTFYGHCKGVSRPVMGGLDKWIAHLYEGNLKAIPDLSEKLFSSVCGKLLPCPPYVPQDFHYSGSFYWFNTEKVKARIKEMPMDRHLTERFPAVIAKQSECLFQYPSFNKNFNYYDERTWKSL